MTSYARVENYHVYLEANGDGPRIAKWKHVDQESMPAQKKPGKGCCGPKVTRRLGILCYSDCGCPVLTKAAWLVIKDAWSRYRRELGRARQKGKEVA